MRDGAQQSKYHVALRIWAGKGPCPLDQALSGDLFLNPRRPESECRRSPLVFRVKQDDPFHMATDFLCDLSPSDRGDRSGPLGCENGCMKLLLKTVDLFLSFFYAGSTPSGRLPKPKHSIESVPDSRKKSNTEICHGKIAKILVRRTSVALPHGGKSGDHVMVRDRKIALRARDRMAPLVVMGRRAP